MATSEDQGQIPLAERLRADLADRVFPERPVRDRRVEEVIRRVPREVFAPEATLEQAYAHDIVVTKRGPEGAVLCCISHPNVVVMMLEQLDVRPGQRVLETGAGTGWRASGVSVRVRGRWW